MGWNLINVSLVGGVGNANIVLPEAGLMTAVSIPIQTGLVSGTTDVVISSLLPDGSLAGALLTLTDVTLPYFEIPQRTPVNRTNVAQTSLVYNTVQSLNVSITGGSGSVTVKVWIFTV